MFQLEEKVGEGSFGSVYKAVHKYTKFVIAMKSLELNGTQSEEILKEIEILKRCRHPNVVNYYGSCIRENKLWVYIISNFLSVIFPIQMESVDVCVLPNITFTLSLCRLTLSLSLFHNTNTNTNTKR
jgi:serine/threonine protein kinase